MQFCGIYEQFYAFSINFKISLVNITTQNTEKENYKYQNMLLSLSKHQMAEFLIDVIFNILKRH